MAKITDAMPRICLCIDNLDRFGHPYVVVRAETAARARWLKDDQWHWTDLGDGKRILRARVAKLAVPAAA